MSVWSEFKEQFQPRPAASATVAEEDDGAERENRLAEIRDLRVFVNTQAYKNLREDLNQMVRATVPQMGMGVEAAAGCAYKQAAFLEVAELLDRTVRQAAEDIQDG